MTLTFYKKNLINSIPFSALIGCLLFSHSSSATTKHESTAGYDCPTEVCTVKLKRLKKSTFYYLTAKINGKQGTFYVDTGKTFIGLTPEFANQLNFKEQDAHITRVKGIKLERNQDIRRISSLSIGDAEFTNTLAEVKDISHFNKHLNTSFDGVIGGEVFKRSVFTIDLPSNELKFLDHNTDTIKGVWSDIKSKANVFYIQSIVDDIKLKMLLDTGASHTTLDPKSFSKITSKTTYKMVTRLTSKEVKRQRASYKQTKYIELSKHVSFKDIVVIEPSKNKLGRNLLMHGVFTVDPFLKRWTFSMNQAMLFC